MPGPWVEKLSDQVKEIVALTLERRVKDPRLGFVTITDVRVTGDGREATVFYSVMPGGDDDQAATAVALESAKGMIRTRVGRKLGLKFVPSLTFVPDTVPEISRAMDELLDRVSELDAELADRRVEGAYAGDPDPYKDAGRGERQLVDSSEAKDLVDERSEKHRKPDDEDDSAW